MTSTEPGTRGDAAPAPRWVKIFALVAVAAAVVFAILHLTGHGMHGHGGGHAGHSEGHAR